MLTDEQMHEKQLTQYCPARRNRRGARPQFHASGSELNNETRMRPWNFDACDEPDEREIRRMWCEAVESMVKQTMKNHCYKFNGKLYRQEIGGSIGLDLTGVVAEIYMTWWDGQLLVLLNQEGIMAIFYKRYVDDVNMVLDTNDTYAEDNDGHEHPRDKLLMEKVRETANKIHNNIKATCDYGSNYMDGKLPVLDVKLWIGEGNDGTLKILHEHYMKDVSSRHLLNYTSAHPETMKLNVLVNEALRIMRNCSKHLDGQVVKDHLQYFVKRMQFSGYPHEYRYEVITRAFKINNRRVEDTVEAMTERRRRKKERRRNWYDREKYDGVMFVDMTMNGELKQRVQEACRRNKTRIKVVEKMNRTVKNSLQRSNPFGWKNCGRTDCPTCTRDIKINCRTRGCVYEIECLDCQPTGAKQYRGQTGRSVYERMKEHFRGWEQGVDDSYLRKHSVEYHNGHAFEVDVRILTQSYGKPSTRMISEAVLIQDLPEENSLNSKAEWTYVKLPRVAVTGTT